MKSRIIILLFSYFLLFNSCMVDNFEEGSLLLDSITEVRLISGDTLFLKKEGTYEVKYLLRYFSKQGEVNLKNTVKPKLFLNGLGVEKAEIDLTQEESYTLQAEIPNNPKLLSNELNIKVLSIINAITAIKLELKGESNVLIPELEDPSFDDLFKIELSLLTGEKLVVNQSFFDFKYVLNGESSDSFHVRDFELGEISEVQIGINGVLSNAVSLEVLSLENAIVEIDLEFIGESNILIPELQEVHFDDLFKIEFNLANRSKLIVGKSDFDFEFLLNGKVFNSLKIEDFELGKVTEVQIGINDVVSNPVKLEILGIKDAVTELELKILDNKTQINKKEIKGELIELIELKAKLKNSSELDLKPFRDVFHLEFNQVKLANLNINQLPDGKSKLRAAVGSIFSNSVDLEVFDPMTYIKSIDLILDERTRNIYAVAGSSELDFDYQVIGMDNTELSISATLYVDGQKQESFKNIPINKSGIVNIQAEISGKKSNAIQIISRQNQVLSKIRVPIVFHVLDNTNQQISKPIIDFEMEKLNQAFSNQFQLQPNLPKSSNAVNIHMEFYLADRDESGNLLPERGINRIPSGGQIFTYSPDDSKFLFQKMWDPRKYVNVFVGRMDWPAGYTFYPVLKDKDLPGIMTISDDYVLDYSYVTVMSDNVMGTPQGLTLAHEIGHMLALFHPFDNNTNGFQCVDGDYCPDTETYLIDATNSPFVSPSNIVQNCLQQTFISVNIMDYVVRRNSFTFDQRERMRIAAVHNPFFAKEINQTNSRLKPFEKGKLNPNIKPVACPNQNHFGRRFHSH